MVGIDNDVRPSQQVDKDAWLLFTESFNHVQKRKDILESFYIEYAKNPTKFDRMLLVPNNITTWLI